MKCYKCGKEVPGTQTKMGDGTWVWACLSCALGPPAYEIGIDWAKGHGPTPFAEPTPVDPTLDALGRTFDDAIDLAAL